MRNIVSAAVLVVGLVLASGCTYTGALRPQVYAQPPAASKISLTVALSVPESFRSQKFHFTTLATHTIQLNPGLSDTIHNALAALFRNVVNAGQSADLIVTPSADIRHYQPVRIGLNFFEPQQRADLGTYQAATPVNWSNPPDAAMAAFLTGFSLFTLAPITLNMEAEASGRNAVARMQEGIARSLETISSQIRSDSGRLVAAVQQASIGHWAKLCDAAADVQQRIRGCTELIARADGRPGLQASAYSQRASAYLRARDVDRAAADVEQALRIEPKHIWAHYYRARIAQLRRQYARAAQEYDEAASIIEASVAAKPDPRLRESGLSIRGQAREMEARGGMEQRWIEYLKNIQASNDFQNWSGPPYDLYRQGQR